MLNKKWLRVGFVCVTTLTVIAFWTFSGMVYLDSNSNAIEEGEVSCIEESIGIVKIHGWIHLTQNSMNYDRSASMISSEIDAYATNPAVKVIILDIYSSGGSTSGADEIVGAIKRSEKPVVAMVREQALSSAYLIASAADTIYADRYGVVGGMGITGSFLSNAGKNQREGLEFVEISSGPHKDMPNRDRYMTMEERAIDQAIVDEHYGIYVKTVSEGRKLPVEVIEKMADGRDYTAEQALKLKLIDKIGNISDIFVDLNEDGIYMEGCNTSAPF